MDILGIVLPMGQSRALLEKSGQWALWEYELNEYRKHFHSINVFEYHYSDWRRFIEALIIPLVERTRFKQCSIMKAVHLTGVVPCLIGRWIYRKPYVLSYGYRYDQFAQIDHKWFQWVMVRFLTPIAITSAAAVMVPTHELESFVRRCGAKKTVVIPNGVDTGLFVPQRTTSYKPLAMSRILFVGRLEKQKNLSSLIKAVSKLEIFRNKRRDRVSKNGISARLILVGEGSLKKELTDIAQALDVDMEVKKPIANNKLLDVYWQADIFVLPSLAEGHPKVLLEAMSCGIPCLASAIPGTTEIITHGRDGWLVEPTVMGIAQGLNHLIRDRQLRLRLGTEARKTVEVRFDKQLLMHKEFDLFRDILK